MKTSLKAVAKLMRDIDYCMFTTQTARGALASRPMSNNREVTYKGSSYFFTWDGSRTVQDIREHSALVTLGFRGKGRIFLSVAGRAKLIKDKATMAEHWVDELSRWFEDGLETEGIMLIHVAAKRIKLWKDEGDAELVL